MSTIMWFVEHKMALFHEDHLRSSIVPDDDAKLVTVVQARIKATELTSFALIVVQNHQLMSSTRFRMLLGPYCCSPYRRHSEEWLRLRPAWYWQRETHRTSFRSGHTQCSCMASGYILRQYGEDYDWPRCCRTSTAMGCLGSSHGSRRYCMAKAIRAIPIEVDGRRHAAQG